MADSVSSASFASPTKVRIFIDYWNLVLTLQEQETRRNPSAARFSMDWTLFPSRLIAEVKLLLKVDCCYEGCTVYASYDAKTEAGKKFKNWATNWLDRQPGMSVNCVARKTKHPPKCNHCHAAIAKSQSSNSIFHSVGQSFEH